MTSSKSNAAQGTTFRAWYGATALALLLLGGAWMSLHAQTAAPSDQTGAPKPTLTFTPSSIVFGTQVVGTSGGRDTVVESVVLKNTGNAPLNISKIAMAGPAAKDFTEKNDCPAALTPGASCNAQITFTPSGNGPRVASLEITDNTPDSPEDLNVGGSGSLFNLPHFHLLINHFPIIGTIIGVGLFLMALFGESEDLEKGSLVIFFAMALIAMPVYMSGNAAADAIRHLPGVSESLITAHEDTALLAYLFMEILGVVAWFGLWEYRRNGHMGKITLAIVLVLSLATTGLMANAGAEGGKIQHEEIMAGPIAAEVGGPTVPSLGLDAEAAGKFVRETKWVWPTLQTLHFMGLSLLLGIVFLVDLRLLGLMKGLPYAAFHRLLPWGVLGFALNVFTGMGYWLAASYQYTLNPMFYLKIIFIMLAGVNALYLTMFEEPWEVHAGDAAPLKVRLIAASAVVLWVGVIFCGIMLPFLGNAF